MLTVSTMRTGVSNTQPCALIVFVKLLRMDRMTPEQRHRCMAAIKGKDTRPELMVRRFLFACGFRYRLNVRRLPGRPDIVLRRFRTVIFVNGCFWHGHEACAHFVLPKTRTAFWKEKIERTRQRDACVVERLHVMGWHCITVWECQLCPQERERTLWSLVYTLSHIYMEHQRPRTLEADDVEALPLVADDAATYGKK